MCDAFVVVVVADDAALTLSGYCFSLWGGWLTYIVCLLIAKAAKQLQVTYTHTQT